MFLFRDIPDYEEDYISSVMSAMFDCNMDKVPLDVLMHIDFNKESTTKSFRECLDDPTENSKFTKYKIPLKDNQRTKYKYKHSHYALPVDCDLPLEHGCSFFNQSDDSETCFRKMRTFERLDLNEIDNQIKHLEATNDTDNTDYKYLKRFGCLSQVAKKYDKCIQGLKDRCLRTSIRVMKTIRSNLQIVLGSLLKKVKDLDIIYNIRDPRAIAHSRVKVKLPAHVARIGGATFKEDLAIQEGKFLCARIQRDVDTIFNNQNNLSEIFYINKYEDLAFDPMFSVHNLYHHLNLPLHTDVLKWLNTSMKRNNGDFLTHRKDPKKTSMAWTTEMSFYVSEGIYPFCKAVLDIFNY